MQPETGTLNGYDGWLLTLSLHCIYSILEYMVDRIDLIYYISIQDAGQ